MAQGGQPVALSDLQPGDVLTFYSDASHAGIYVGDGMMIHSSTYGVPVRVVPMDAVRPDLRRPSLLNASARAGADGRRSCWPGCWSLS